MPKIAHKHSTKAGSVFGAKGHQHRGGGLRDYQTVPKDQMSGSYHNAGGTFNVGDILDPFTAGYGPLLLLIVAVGGTLLYVNYM